MTRSFEERTRTMDNTLFEELLASTGEALDHANGKRDLRTTILPPAPAPMTAADVRASSPAAQCFTDCICALLERECKTGTGLGVEPPKARGTGAQIAATRGSPSRHPARTDAANHTQRTPANSGSGAT